MHLKQNGQIRVGSVWLQKEASAREKVERQCQQLASLLFVEELSTFLLARNDKLKKNKKQGLLDF